MKGGESDMNRKDRRFREDEDHKWGGYQKQGPPLRELERPAGYQRAQREIGSKGQFFGGNVQRGQDKREGYEPRGGY